MIDVSHTNNTHQPFYNYIFIKQLDFAVTDWCEKFFDRVVLPCKDWMDERAWLGLEHDARSLRDAVIEGDITIDEIKRRASAILRACAIEFQRFDEQRKAQQVVELH